MTHELIVTLPPAALTVSGETAAAAEHTNAAADSISVVNSLDLLNSFIFEPLSFC
jgi:hypothetical protein